jgi:Transposase, Mutator family
VNGVSTRKVDRLVEQLGIDGMTKDRVSAMCRRLMSGSRFRQRPLEGAYPYLWLDAPDICSAAGANRRPTRRTYPRRAPTVRATPCTTASGKDVARLRDRPGSRAPPPPPGLRSRTIGTTAQPNETDYLRLLETISETTWADDRNAARALARTRSGTGSLTSINALRSSSSRSSVSRASCQPSAGRDST